MTNRDELVEAVARAFHGAYERLAPGFHYDTRPESAVPWERVPDTNRKLMVAVVGEVVPLVEADVSRRVRASIEALDVRQWEPDSALIRRADVLAVVADAVREEKP